MKGYICGQMGRKFGGGGGQVSLQGFCVQCAVARKGHWLCLTSAKSMHDDTVTEGEQLVCCDFWESGALLCIPFLVLLAPFGRHAWCRLNHYPLVTSPKSQHQNLGV